MNVWLTIAMTGTGLVFVAIAIPLIRRRIPPNRLYGLRVPATFAEWVWYEANARSGRDLLCFGILLTVLAIVLPILGAGATAYVAWAVVVSVGAIAIGIMGWRRANELLRERRLG